MLSYLLKYRLLQPDNSNNSVISKLSYLLKYRLLQQDWKNKIINWESVVIPAQIQASTTSKKSIQQSIT